VWLRAVAISLGAIGSVTVLGGTAATIAAECQCHYTPVLFAEREGLTRVTLPNISVEAWSDGRRRQLVSRLDELDVFVDPTFAQGASDVVAVYANPHDDSVKSRLRTIESEFGFEK
jgi:hypothetical protein